MARLSLTFPGRRFWGVGGQSTLLPAVVAPCGEEAV